MEQKILGYQYGLIENERQWKGKSPSNIALIKYWGKRDESWFAYGIAILNHRLFYSETEAVFSDDFDRDYFYLNGSCKKD